MTREEAMQTFPPMWIIYDSPLDYPGEFVVRTWWGDQYSELLGRFETTREAILAILSAGGSTTIGRDPSDDPVIKEVWL